MIKMRAAIQRAADAKVPLRALLIACRYLIACHALPLICRCHVQRVDYAAFAHAER